MQLKAQSIATVARALGAGETTSRALVEIALEAIAADGRAFTHVDFAGARGAADASDKARANGLVPSALAGIPISVKDLFDVAGEPTQAGSLLLRNAPPAARDAPVIGRLRDAGAVIVGRTHMSELAFTGLGLNPHWPPLPNPHDEQRAPGGSSSGAAVSVARGQSVAALGTDTGGSVRIPAAFCGLTGFKPTQARITREGTFPLSPSLDSIGPIANSVACCRAFDAVIADTPITPHPEVAPGQLRFAVPSDVVLDELDEAVARDFEAALACISRAGAQVGQVRAPEFSELSRLNARGALANAEAYAVHLAAGLLERREGYDPDVLARIEVGERMSADEVREIRAARSALSMRLETLSKAYDALLFPTVAIVAPRLADIAEPRGFARANALALRNAALVNFFDRCALSLPMHKEGALPTGLMIVGERLGDARLLAVGEAIERVLRRQAQD
jgi:aspartyl-tRNA(Asn)/glutamyl-tRNA(Gln) amidotransferase subunit A